MAKFMESTSSIKKSVKKKKEDESAKAKTTKAASSKPKTQSSVSSRKAQTQKTVNRLSNKYAGGSTRNTSKPKATTTKPKATTTTTTAPKRATTTTSRNPRMQDAVVQSKPAQTTRRDTTPVSSQKSRQVQQNLQQKYGENKVNNTVKRRDTTPVKSAADKAFEKQRDRVSVSRNPRMQDTARNTKVQSRAERQESINTAKRAIRNTPTVAKESAKQVLQGHGKTAADVTAMNNSAAIGSRIDIKSPEFMRDIEKRRETSTSTARKTFKELAKAQDRSEQRLNNITKNARGLEKAYYGAVQAGTGILTDMAIGGGTQAGSLAAMGSRVYGNTRGTAQREGATESEDRLYSFMQAAKEVGTELMFPGVGLAGKAYGKKAALPLAERIANRATRNLTGKAADVAGAGIKLLGGTAEENLEEVAGWGLDPLIKEYTYGKNVRVRGTKDLMQQESNALRSNIRTREDADRAASYLNSQDFLDENVRQYMDAGLSQEQAQKAALQMRDYLTASLTGNTQEMQRLESDIMKTVSNKKWTLADWDRNELADTLMSTTLLTGVTGLPGAVATSRIGNNVFNDPDVRKFFGDDAQKVVANEVINSSDETNSLRAQAMRDRLNSGKDLTGTQKYDLWRGYQQKTMATAEKHSASVDLAERNIEKNNYVQPVTLDENGRWNRAVRNEYEYYQLGDETQRKYEENFDSALATAETLRASVKSEEDSEAKSITETTEDRTRQAAAAVAALKDGYLTIGDVHEFGFGNTLARETLKAETGIDLNQYIVRNSDGTVNYAKTNEATENALFAIAADNMVKTAKAETETFIDHRKGEIDKDLMTRFGAEGQKAWKDINKSLDPRDTARYLASANAASYMYAAGRNTTLDQNEAVRSMGNVFRSVDNNVLAKSFEAGRQDREIAMAPAVGQTVSATDSMAGTDTVSIPTGSLTMDEDMPRSIPDSEQQIYKALAEATGVNIHLASHLDLKDDEGNVVGQANGSSYGDTIILNANSAAEQNLGYVFMHEMTHQIKKYAPAEYTKLENLIRDAWFEKDYAGMQREIKHKIDLYGNRAGQTLSEDMAMEEIVADAMAEAIDDPRFARAVCTEDVGMGKAILNSIRNALRSLRDMIANTVFRQNNNFHKNLLSYLDVLSEAESLWIRALNEATKARAAQAVDTLQNQIYEEGRLSVSETEEDEETRFSISEPVERVKDLIAVHNLKPDDIRNTFELGGFPMPSIAVTKDSMGHDLYGDITLMFNSNTIDPQFNRNNQVFGGDAWTPTFPTIRHKHNEKVTDKIRDLYYDNANRIGYDAMRPLYDVAVTPEDAINRYGGEQGLKEHFMKDTSIMRTFLKMNDKDVEDVVTRTETTLSDTEQKLRQHMIDSLGEDAVREWEGADVPNGSEKAIYRRQWVENHLDEIKDAYKSFMRSGPFHFSEEEVDNVISNMKLIEFVKLMRNASNFLNDGATTVKEEVDRKATDERVKIAAQENGYGAWVNSLLDGIEEKQGIRNDKDAFTRQGNRRSWESLHEPVTLENVVKVMRSELAAGGNGIVGANPKGAAQKNYKNLDEIRSDEDRLQQLPEEEFKELEGSATQKLVDVCQDIVDSNPKRFDNKFGATLDVGEYVAEILNETRDKSSIHKRLQKDYTLKVTDEQMDALMGAIDEIANLPTGYFEAKPRRAVGFDEVKAAIIPASTDEDIKKGFNDRGIQMYEYDPEVEGDRTAKVNEAASAQDLRFSISSDLDEPYMSAVNSGNMEEAQRLVDEAAKVSGLNSPLLYHGTYEQFTTFKGNEFLSEINGLPQIKGYFSEDRDVSEVYGDVSRYYVGINNPLDFYDVPWSQTETEWRKWFESKGVTGIKFDSSIYEDTLKEHINDRGENEYSVFEIFDGADMWAGDGNLTERIAVAGYDGMRWDYDEKAWMPFDDKRIKSADTITYREDGSVIPLSERFDPSNNDIRYSLPTQDSDGNILSDGQMEYFKNSLAVDEQGKLIPVYHASSMGGFTIFDPMRSDDHRSLFFTSKRIVAQSYVEKHLYTDEDRLGDESRDVRSWGELLDYARDQFLDAGLDWDNDYDDVNLDWTAYHKDTGKFAADIDYDTWLRMNEEGDPEAKNYTISISLPYIDGEDVSSIKIEGNGMEDLLNNVSNTVIPHTGYYQVYLNLENPLIIEGKGQQWNSIVNGGSVIKDGSNVLIKNSSWFRDKATRNDELFGEDHPLEGGNKLRATADELERNNHVRVEIYTGGNGVKEFDVPSDADDVQRVINETFGFEDEDDFGYSIAEELLPELEYDTYTRIDTADMRAMIDEYGYNTREWAEYAEDLGHDGVIFRDIVDVDNKSYVSDEDAHSDIYIAFSSNQVKDTRNENPTENPDIRWSVPEDEVKSRIAYDDAMDNSYEALEAYEAYISEHPDDVESYVAKNFDEETVSAFNSALVDYSGRMFDDKILEDGRVRIASSREDFYRSVNAKWRESWPTEGEVLNIDSVKGNIRKLVRGVMANADANHQYKTDVANMTLADARTAFQLMKQGRQEYAMNLLYHSAQRMVEGIQFVQDDTEFQTYKEIRAFMRNSKVSIDEEYWNDVEYQKFHRENMSRMKLIRGKQNVEDVYSDLQDNWPWIFNEEEREKIGLGNDVPALLLHIGHVLDQNLTPFMAAYSSEDATALCFDIADQLYDIIEAGRPIKSLADSMNKRDAKKLDKLYDQMEENAANAEREYTKSIEDLKEQFDQQTKALKVRHDEAVRKVKANMAEMEEAKNAEIDKLKAEANDSYLLQKRAIAKEREAKWQAIEEEKAKRAKETERANMWRGRYRERIQKDVQDRKEKADKRDHRKLFNDIEDDYDWLAKAVLDPTKDKYIPEAFRKSLADLLQQIDLQTENSKKLEEKYGRVAQNTLKLRELKDRLADLSTKKAADATNLFDIDAYLPYLMDAMAEKLDGQSIDAMDASDIKTFWILFKSLRKNFQNLNRETAESKTAIALEKAERIVAESMGKVKRDGLAKEYKGARAALNKINMTSLTPVYFFERMGTVNDIYRDLRRGFDTYIRNEKEITDKLTQILAPFYKKGRKISRGSDIEEWRDGRSAQRLELTYGPVTMTAAQRMSLLCLANRDQAMQHMMLGGIVVTPYEAGTRKEAIEAYTKGVNALGDKVVLSSTDIDTIRASLTPEQIKVATQLQQLMANDMAKLGNEAHREMYGYEIFDDQDYFPIKSKDTWIPKDVNNMNDAVERIKSYGPAKPLDPNASNAIVIDDIFSVVADHCNGMNLYNAYLVPISNFMKVYNFTITLEDGTRKPVQDALEEAYGKDALKYIDNFIRDLNGIKNTNRGGLEDVMDAAIGRAKAVAVAGNIRVAAQQPTAIVRAAAEINPKYLTPFLEVRPEKGVLNEMYKYCPIAQWKSWGYYDTYMGRDIEDVMMNNWSVKDTVLTGGYGLLDNLTWGAIWQAVKQEQHDLHPKMDMKSEAFLRICGDRASEIFDKTQVVDSTFHRSDAMRNKDRWMKLFTAFMSEPTLTLNVFRAAVYNASEAWKAGDKTKAFGIMRKAISVLLVQAAFVSIAQALADAWRGKDPGLPWDDDDDDEPSESYWARFLHNMVYNMFDQLHLENNMYLIKDVTPYINYMISKGADYADNRLEEGGHESARKTLGVARAVMGWDQDYLYSQNNLVFAAFENAANGTAQIFKKLEKGEDYDKGWYDIMQKTFSGFGTALGIPAGTLMRDFKPIWDKVFASAFAADSTGEIAKAVSSIGKSGKSSSKESKSEDSEGSGSEGSWDDVYKELEAEEQQLAKLEEKAAKKAASAPAGQRDEVLWDTLTDGYTTKLKEGHMDYIDSLRDIYVRNGGREEVFDSKLLDGIKRSYKSTINAENTADQMEGQYDMQQFMLNHGVTAEEISDMCYHSYTAKDLKAAMRLGNEEYMIDELVPLIQAGFSEEDFNKCWKQRYNYRNYTGKYTDPKYRISTGEYAWPITGTITSRFGGRKSPGGIGSTNHMGLDIAGSMGDPVHAADGGEVIYADWWYGGGNVVRIRHENGEVTEYMHLSGYNCKVGDHVGKGDQIGQVGSTGNSTGPHLHFGVMDKDGNHLDPEVILAQSSKG